MTYSYEIDRKHSDNFPPFVDGCEHCLPSGWNGVVVPFATVTYGDSLTAFYHHGRCDRTWFTSFGAQWSHTWVRVVPEQRRGLPPGPRALPPGTSGNGQVAA